MENKNKNLWIWVGVIAVVIIGILFWSMSQTSNAPAVTDNTVNDQEVIPTEDVTEGSINVGVPAASISYQNALVKYKDARLQLDKTCQASPDKMTFKDGAYMMVDNRAAVARTVKAGSTFSIKAYGFKIIKLSSATLPATWLVDCGSSQNVATITIQK